MAAHRAIADKHFRVVSHYQIEVAADETGEKAVAVTWTRRPRDGSMATHPGVYCLRSSETAWDEDALWRTYTTLTDVEAVFRSLKSEVGLRPIYHHKPRRADAHLFITVIAYQLVQVIRTRLHGHGNPASWTTLRRILDGQQRVTATDAPTGARCTCARPRKPNPGSGTSTMRSASTRTPGTFARPSSDRPSHRFGHVCSATPAFCRLNPLVCSNLDLGLVNLG